ncbi:hypothetical protein ARMGADRAFT_1038618 [Armillaria gallica]|uniref:Uncharacterized protein n=1 Tax=Armillaria gallica TaxID=47427 RepID=A0A2H3D2B9_ARMGA|nr:hypothetical protein ARMGADRAFT_1038618 [Armillaria gallica]
MWCGYMKGFDDSNFKMAQGISFNISDRGQESHKAQAARDGHAWMFASSHGHAFNVWYEVHVSFQYKMSSGSKDTWDIFITKPTTEVVYKWSGGLDSFLKNVFGIDIGRHKGCDGYGSNEHIFVDRYCDHTYLCIVDGNKLQRLYGTDFSKPMTDMWITLDSVPGSQHMVSPAHYERLVVASGQYLEASVRLMTKKGHSQQSYVSDAFERQSLKLKHGNNLLEYEYG